MASTSDRELLETDSTSLSYRLLSSLERGYTRVEHVLARLSRLVSSSCSSSSSSAGLQRHLGHLQSFLSPHPGGGLVPGSSASSVKSPMIGRTWRVEQFKEGSRGFYHVEGHLLQNESPVLVLVLHPKDVAVKIVIVTNLRVEIRILQLNKVSEGELSKGEEDDNKAADDVDVQGGAVRDFRLDVAHKADGDDGEAAGHSQAGPGGGEGG